MAINKRKTLTLGEENLVRSFQEKLEDVGSRADLIAFVKFCNRAMREFGYIPFESGRGASEEQN